jgi:hypothetical protein
MGSKKALGKARRAWEDKVRGPRHAAASVLDYAIPTHDAIQFLQRLLRRGRKPTAAVQETPA